MKYAFATQYELDDGVAAMLNGFGHEEDKAAPAFLVYTGGADVTPQMYLGDEEMDSGWHMYCDKISGSNMRRDEEGAAAFICSDLPMLGICRGAQFLNVCAGYKLHRHILGHGIHGTHKIALDGGGTLDVTSTHHQCMSSEPYKFHRFLHRLVLGRAGPVDEIVLFSAFGKRNLLCIQGHPEYLDLSHEFPQWTKRAIDTYLNNKKEN